MHRSAPTPSWIRLSLLAAALLYGGGAMAEPLLHLEDVSALAQEEGPGPTAPETPQDDFCCTLCQNLGGAAQLAAATQLPQRWIAGESLRPTARARTSSISPSLHQARAPPLS